mmetsp:Transcript_13711/g.18769  ORF Transcript_13711/g.18769 Transcript_13711/m.18769 type:complete len:204 (+) Transcript_13711:322-933(+)
MRRKRHGFGEQGRVVHPRNHIHIPGLALDGLAGDVILLRTPPYAGPLTYREHFTAAVTAYHLSSVHINESAALQRHVSRQELGHGSLADEADAHALLLLQHSQATQGLSYDLTDLILVIISQRHQNILQAFAIHEGKEIRLILYRIYTPPKLWGCFSLHYSGIMTSGQCGDAQILTYVFFQMEEFDEAIAKYIGVRGQYSRFV